MSSSAVLKPLLDFIVGEFALRIIPYELVEPHIVLNLHELLFGPFVVAVDFGASHWLAFQKSLVNYLSVLRSHITRQCDIADSSCC